MAGKQNGIEIKFTDFFPWSDGNLIILEGQVPSTINGIGWNNKYLYMQCWNITPKGSRFDLFLPVFLFQT